MELERTHSYVFLRLFFTLHVNLLLVRLGPPIAVGQTYFPCQTFGFRLVALRIRIVEGGSIELVRARSVLGVWIIRISTFQQSF
jgi:hypothetical protein